MGKLSTEQQQIIIDSLWVVNKVLKRQNLAYNEDLRQNAILYLCECLNRYKCEFGAKWTTYAYKCINLFIRRTLEKERQTRCRELYINREFAVVEKVNSSRSLYCEIKENCNENEKRLLELKLKGYADREVSDILGLGKKKIWKLKREIKEKARLIRDEQTLR